MMKKRNALTTDPADSVRAALHHVRVDRDDPEQHISNYRHAASTNPTALGGFEWVLLVTLLY